MRWSELAAPCPAPPWTKECLLSIKKTETPEFRKWNQEKKNKKIKWQLDKLQLELSACRILVAQEILLMPKEGQ